MGFLNKIEAISNRRAGQIKYKASAGIKRSDFSDLNQRRTPPPKLDINEKWRDIVESTDLPKELKLQLNDFIVSLPDLISQAKIFKSYIDTVVERLSITKGNPQENNKAKELGNKFLKDTLKQIKQETSIDIDI